MKFWAKRKENVINKYAIIIAEQDVRLNIKIRCIYQLVNFYNRHI